MAVGEQAARGGIFPGNRLGSRRPILQQVQDERKGGRNVILQQVQEGRISGRVRAAGRPLSRPAPLQQLQGVDVDDGFAVGEVDGL